MKDTEPHPSPGADARRRLDRNSGPARYTSFLAFATAGALFTALTERGARLGVLWVVVPLVWGVLGYGFGRRIATSRNALGAGGRGFGVATAAGAICGGLLYVVFLSVESGAFVWSTPILEKAIGGAIVYALYFAPAHALYGGLAGVVVFGVARPSLPRAAAVRGAGATSVSLPAMSNRASRPGGRIDGAHRAAPEGTNPTHTGRAVFATAGLLFNAVLLLTHPQTIASSARFWHPEAMAASVGFWALDPLVWGWYGGRLASGLAGTRSAWRAGGLGVLVATIACASSGLVLSLLSMVMHLPLALIAVSWALMMAGARILLTSPVLLLLGALSGVVVFRATRRLPPPRPPLTRSAASPSPRTSAATPSPARGGPSPSA